MIGKPEIRVGPRRHHVHDRLGDAKKLHKPARGHTSCTISWSKREFAPIITCGVANRVTLIRYLEPPFFIGHNGLQTMLASCAAGTELLKDLAARDALVNMAHRGDFKPM